MNSKNKTRLRKILEQRAPNQQCISYKDIASVLDITQPPVIATIAYLLELLIDEDVAAKRPVLSALVIQKGQRKIPRIGFFEKLNELKIIDISDSTFDEVIWHTDELNKLKIFYKK